MMDAKVDNHPWSEDALFQKAALFVGRMEHASADHDVAGIWSAIALELLARAALAHASPVLLADYDKNNDWHQLEYALGRPSTAKKFIARSIPTAKVIARLVHFVPGFEGVRRFCESHIGRRNAELHTGETVFGERKTWLPDFYKTCSVLAQAVGRKLDDLTDDPDSAREMIDALDDEAAKSVAGDIKSYRKVWEGKEDAEREQLAERAELRARRDVGHRQPCPSCGSVGLLQGKPRGPVVTVADEGNYEVTQKQRVLPQRFQCFACGLRVDGLSKLQAAELGAEYTATTIHDPADFFDLYTQEDIDEARAGPPEEEPDFNE